MDGFDDQLARQNATLERNSSFCYTLTKKLFPLAMSKILIKKVWRYGDEDHVEAIEIIGHNIFFLSDQDVDVMYESLKLSNSKFYRNLLQIKAFNLNKTLQAIGTNDPVVESLTFGSAGVIVANILTQDLVDLVIQISNYNLNQNNEMSSSQNCTLKLDLGKKFDSNGNFVGWVSNETEEMFKKRDSCLAQQYDSYRKTYLNLPLVTFYQADSPNSTVNVNFMDPISIKLALLAYSQWLKANQFEERLPGFVGNNHIKIFLYAFSQSWCNYPDPEDSDFKNASARVNLPLMNFEGLAKIYGCSPGRKMNPADKCYLIANTF
ncbi:hypothetical protein HELRODRAFT_184276 [Helobdella robusta]|uniref:Peptidase M13 C-terminal domain-containing protein n=1 Tax=Helobdella robusta TaxID=6412 RepID=T1FKW6_HELRO|nr:hypothetical protein HELRODRAFT_184276 [Helobdella robusta]ESO03508.1 hypothetical protein HELRODRAFT_184276 [Helobdella robusta]